MSAVLVDQVPVPVQGRAHLRLVVDNGALVPRVQRPADRAPIVLTDRGRLVARLLGTLAGLVAAVVLGVLLGLLLRPAPAVATGVVTVAPGDSLWTVATAVAGTGGDPRDVVEQIVVLNGLTDDVVQPGQELLVPGA